VFQGIYFHSAYPRYWLQLALLNHVLQFEANISHDASTNAAGVNVGAKVNKVETENKLRENNLNFMFTSWFMSIIQ